MSEARDPRPSMVAPNPYGGPTLLTVPAEQWRPPGTEGEVVVQVTEEFMIVETIKDHERVIFPVGSYPIATRIRVKRRVPVGDGATEEREVWLNIGGRDESSMHPTLTRYGVKHSSLQPSAVPAFVGPLVLERFWACCGRERGKPHARGCPSYVAPPRPAARRRA